ncbi:MAG: phosphoglucosamine mutase, partial [Bacillota bacterium]
MSRMFGTDGVRGIANSHELSPELAYRLGRAGAYLLTQEATAQGQGRPRLVIGMDTRASGEMLEAALVAGICSVGVDAVRVGVVTTPAVAFLISALQAQGGVMISASHNPAEYNGIKFFSASGYKLPDAVEDQLEDLVRSEEDTLPRPTGGAVGRAVDRPDAAEAYVAHVVSTVAAEDGDRPWQGLKIVVDCANGASYRLAPEVYRRLGAEVIVMADSPDGVNINVHCGSTHPEGMQEAVRRHGAHLGIAHDGDADRVILADEKGELVDGDHVLALCGLHLLRAGK